MTLFHHSSTAGYTLTLFTLLFMGACSTYLHLPGQPQSYPPGHYLQWLETANTETLTREQARLQQDDAAFPASTVARVQLALLLSVSTLASREHEEEALSLVSGLEASSASTSREREYLQFAELWRQILMQNRLLQEQQLESESLQQELATLQEQIANLTRIERQLIEREQRQE